jgi:phage-related protein
MADIYGSHFEYGGVSSRQYDLIIVNADTSRMVQLYGEKKGVTIFSKIANKRYLIDDDYSSSPLTFDVEIMTDSDRCLEPAERRQIEKWLFNRKSYRKLYMDIADDERGETYEYINGDMKRNYLNCRLVNPEKLEGNGGIVGYKATLEADSNMFWQEPIEQLFDVNNGSANSVSNITITVDTDLEEYIYPVVTIRMGNAGGDVIIANNSDDSTRQTKFVGLGGLATVVMKGELNYVSGQYYEKFAGRNFIRLLDGVNTFTITGNVESIMFEYSARRAL